MVAYGVTETHFQRISCSLICDGMAPTSQLRANNKRQATAQEKVKVAVGRGSGGCLVKVLVLFGPGVVILGADKSNKSWWVSLSLFKTK